MDAPLVGLLIALAVVAAAVLCWFAVRVAVWWTRRRSDPAHPMRHHRYRA